MLEDGDNDAPSTMLNAIPLGSKNEVTQTLERFNIAPDGSPESIGLLYGPGLTVQLPMVGADDPITQAVVSIDEEIGWPVVTRICKALGWKMMDPGTGRTFG
jgi:hypothetical protein